MAGRSVGAGALVAFRWGGGSNGRQWFEGDVVRLAPPLATWGDGRPPLVAGVGPRPPRGYLIRHPEPPTLGRSRIVRTPSYRPEGCAPPLTTTFHGPTCGDGDTA
eukprot:9476498-Pyramimonas_sp.AAC.1